MTFLPASTPSTSFTDLCRKQSLSKMPVGESVTASCRIYSQSPDATGIISKSFHSQFFLFLVEFLRFYAMLLSGWVDNQERFTKHMSLSALEFAIFCIEEIALKLQIPGSAVYDMLSKRSDILSSYIIPSYDVLHTQSKEYIVDDIIALMREEGVWG